MLSTSFPLVTLTWHGDESSDTDLVIQTPEPFDDERKKGAPFQLAASMRNSRITQYVQVIHRARVPVISFETQQLGESPALPCYDSFASADSGVPTHFLTSQACSRSISAQTQPTA